MIFLYISSALSKYSALDQIKFQAGYIPLNANDSLYYIFFPSENQPSDPVILWSNGGPLCSSTFGAFKEVGPATFQLNSSDLSLNPYSWNKQAHLLVIDYPCSVGYSKSKRMGRALDDFDNILIYLEGILKFYQIHSQLKENPLYLSGQSYGGIIMTELAELLLSRNQMQVQTRINLKGLILNNACVDQNECMLDRPLIKAEMEQLYYRGFFSQQDLNDYYSGDRLKLRKIYQRWDSFNVQLQNINQPCFFQKDFIRRRRRLRLIHRRHLAQAMLSCGDDQAINQFLNDPAVKKKLKAQTEWKECSDDQYISTLTGVYEKMKRVSTKLTVLFFTGDDDVNVPSHPTIRWAYKLKTELQINDTISWRKWLVDQPADFRINYSNGKLTQTAINNVLYGGYVWQFENVTIATVIGGGHMAVRDQPREVGSFLWRHLKGEYFVQIW